MHASDSITVAELAAFLGISEAAIRKNKKAREYMLPEKRSTGARPGLLFSADVVKLWRPDFAPAPVRVEARKLRADCGKPRKVDEHTWRRIVDRVRGLYLSNAQANLLFACEEAVRQLADEGLDVTINVYKTLKRKAFDHDGLHISPFFREGWEALHGDKWRRRDAAVNGPHVTYDPAGIFESIGWAGSGFGACRMWSVDGRKADSWARRDDGRGVMPYAIYINDALTGYPLWIEPVETESKQGVISALLKCMTYWRRVPDLGIVLDGGVVNTAKDTVGIISTMLEPVAWEYAASYPEIYGRGGSPIIMNAPYIPTSIFKASLERSFKLRKDEYDAPRNARTYQGGSRFESVQLTVAATPIINSTTLSVPDYFSDYFDWTYSAYIDRPRPDKFPLIEQRGISPTIKNAFAYYGGFTSPERLPDVERIAILLYWASEDKTIVKARRGHARTGRGATERHWICADLDHRYMDQYVAIVPIPGDAMNAAVLLANDPSKPRYIGLAHNSHANTIEALRQVRPATAAARAEVNQRFRVARDSYAEASFRNTERTTEVPSVPALTEWRSETKGLITAPSATPKSEADDHGEISADTAALLRDIENTL